MNGLSFQREAKSLIPMFLLCREEYERSPALLADLFKIVIMCDRHSCFALPGKVRWNSGVGNALSPVNTDAQVAIRPLSDNGLVPRDNFLMSSSVPVEIHASIVRLWIHSSDPRSSTIPRMIHKFSESI